jgi:hypothetical protein
MMIRMFTKLKKNIKKFNESQQNMDLKKKKLQKYRNNSIELKEDYSILQNKTKEIIVKRDK